MGEVLASSFLLQFKLALSLGEFYSPGSLVKLARSPNSRATVYTEVEVNYAEGCK